jgi:hypothetical protein
MGDNTRWKKEEKEFSDSTKDEKIKSNVANKKCNNVSYIHYISLKKYYGGIGAGIFSAKVWPRRPAISTFVSHSDLVLISLNSVCRSEIFYRHLPITKIISFQSKSF